METKPNTPTDNTNTTTKMPKKKHPPVVPRLSIPNPDVLIQKLETDAATKVQHVFRNKEPVTTDTFLNILKQGTQEFKKKSGREMSYSEMRETFG